ncbi:Gfo/Idh/MocA family protein [Halobaculum sp. EA56]|uniref:Gfo/Idh/MocA family protein n=1 Tax=Halobaculum sp. EA56 TaxID=3421648 RepID=UPI003EBE92A6
MTSTMNAALIGCGIAGQDLHLPCIHQLPNAKLTGVCDLDPDLRQTAAAKYGVNGYGSLENLIENENIDVLHVATPPQTHADIAEVALENSINTVIEKPLAATLEECDRIIQAEKSSDAQATVIHNQQFFPEVVRVLEKINSGEGSPGEVVSVSMLFGERRNLDESERGNWVFELPGGEIGEGLPHQIYLPLKFAGGLDTIDNISKYKKSDAMKSSFDSLSIELRGGDGETPVSIKVFTTSINQNLLHIHCEDKEFQIELNKKYVTTNDMIEVTIPSLITGNLSQITQLINSNVRTGFGISSRLAKRVFGNYSVSEYGIGHLKQIDRFYDCIESGGIVPVTLQEGKDTIKVLENIDK